MKEVGIDISQVKPKLLTFEMFGDVGRVITMVCVVSDICPSAMVEAEDWGIEDPDGKSIEKFREVRNVIREKVKQLVKNLEG